MKLLERVDSGDYISGTDRSIVKQFEIDGSEAIRLIDNSKTINDILGKGHNPLNNGFFAAVMFGAKGKDNNITRVSGAYGMVSLRTGWPDRGLYGRTIPTYHRDTFMPNTTCLINGSFVDGITSDQSFLDIKAAREGVIDTAIKTQESGYISRRLVKFLEDDMVTYDGTVRTGQNGLIQFLFGQNGCDSQKMENIKLVTLKMDNAAMRAKYEWSRSAAKTADEWQLAQDEMAELLSERDDMRDLSSGSYNSMFIESYQMPFNMERIIANWIGQQGENINSDLTISYVIEKMAQMWPKLAKVHVNEWTEPDERHWTSIWLLRRYIHQYMASKPVLETMTRATFDGIYGEILVRYAGSLVTPGEMVGILAALNIAERTTQLTLNTFHSSGHAGITKVTRGSVTRMDNLIRVSEKKLEEHASLSITLPPDVASNLLAAKQIANQMAYINLSGFILLKQIIYEPESNPHVAAFNQDSKMVETFGRNIASKVTPVVSRWMIRIVLDGEKMYSNGLTISQIREAILRDYSSSIYIVNSSQNSPSLVLRIHLIPSEIPEMSKGKGISEKDVAFKYMQIIENDIAIRGIRGIVSATAVQAKKKETVDEETGAVVAKEQIMIVTEGSNLSAILGMSGIEQHKVHSTNILEVFNVLGIEACRNALHREINAVGDEMASYHSVGLLIDQMTHLGHPVAVFSSGFSKTKLALPFTRISFEESTSQLVRSAIEGEIDNMHGISDNITYGQRVYGGTGYASFEVDVDALGVKSETVESIVKLIFGGRS